MTSTDKGISGLAVAVLGAGALFIWSGVENQTLLISLRHLAMGKPIPSGVHKVSARNRDQDGPSHRNVGSGGNQRVVDIAASYEGRPYLFGGGHGTVCPNGPMDCSGYVSCVLNKAGLMTGTLTTDGFKSWGVGIPYEDRQPGDIVVWVGGPGGGHMGIVAGPSTMWHSPCTGCGGVQKARYGRTRGGRTTIVRRARNG